MFLAAVISPKIGKTFQSPDCTVANGDNKILITADASFLTVNSSGGNLCELI
jgi:hypothetical protein